MTTPNGKSFFAGNDQPESNKTHTRTGIMLVLLPAVHAALSSIPGLDLTSNVAHLRRTVRAITTLAVRMMLDAGADPKTVAATMIEALAHEVDERMEAQAAAQAASANVPTATA